MLSGSCSLEWHSQALAVVAGCCWAPVSFSLLAHLPLFSPFPEIPRTCHLQGAAADDAAGRDPAPHATQSPLPHQVTSPSHVWGGNRCCLWAESPVGSVPAPGRSFSLGSQTAPSLPLEPGLGAVGVPLGCSVHLSHQCFFELCKLLVCVKIKTDSGSPGSLPAWRDRGDISPSPVGGSAGFWLERHSSCSPCVAQRPPGDSWWDTDLWAAPAAQTALKAETRVSQLGFDLSIKA